MQVNVVNALEVTVFKFSLGSLGLENLIICPIKPRVNRNKLVLQQDYNYDCWLSGSPGFLWASQSVVPSQAQIFL